MLGSTTPSSDPGVYNMSLVRGYVVGERMLCMDKMDDMKMDE